MVTGGFRQVVNRPKAAPLQMSDSGFFGRGEKPHGTYSERFLFDAGNGGDNAVGSAHAGIGPDADDLEEEANIL